MRRLGAVVGVLILVAAATAAGYAIRTASEPETAPPETIPTETASVIRTDLVSFETLSGTLQYAGEGEVRTALPGTITGLPSEAQRLDRGDTVYEIDGLPVILMIGDRPAWRTIADGVDDGSDVEQLESNLVALGFGPEGWEPDESFDGDTADAVEAWRESAGLPEESDVEFGRVVFVPEPIRVGAVPVAIGQLVPAGTLMYSTTGFDQEVLIDLDPDDVDLVSEGAPVTVVLPDDREIAGRITDVGRVVVPSGPDPGSAGILEVRVALDEAAIDLDQAPVEVEVESERAAGVLAVPVRALVALADGGYAVEVEGQLIGVEIGDFAGGLVEVSGALEEGDQVVVPR